MNFLKKNIEEISQQKSLATLGHFLLLVHVLTITFWYQFDFSFGPVSWPGLNIGLGYSHWLRNQWIFVLSLYSLMTGLGHFFLIRKRFQTFYFILIAVNIMKFLIQLSDFRMMGNYHYMPYLISFCFLFLRNKTDLIRIMIVLFYFSAGAIKFNSDWMSGAALLRVSFFQGYALQIALAYVIILEMFVVFFLLSKKKILFYFAFIQVLFFHFYSYQVVGYFYPSIMACLLSSFLLFKSPISKKLASSTWVAIGLFLATQLYVLIFHPNSSIDGTGRVLSLNMLDARSQCETHFYIKTGKTTIEHSPSFSQYGVRIQCDPALVVNESKELCEKYKDDPDFEQIDFYHQARRISDPVNTFSLIFTDVCRKKVKVDLLGNISND